jgi:Zn-dependent metalloprotease
MVLQTPLRKAAVATALAGLATITVAGIGMAAADAKQPPPEPRSLAATRTLAANAAGSFISEHPEEFNAGGGDRFLRRPVISSNGTQYVPYQRTYAGLPVVGGDFVIATDSDGHVVATSVAQDKTIDKLDTQPSVRAARAVKIAKARVSKVTNVSKPRLVVHALGTPRLAWETVVKGVKAGEPSRQSVYVDASTGKLIGAKEHVVYGEGTGAYSGPNPLALDTTDSGGTFTMKDPNRALECQDAANNETFSGPDDKWGDGDASSKETGCVDGLFAVQTEWKMLKDWFGRDGMDGKGGAWPLRVGLDDVNAYYDGTQVQIGHNQKAQWISSIDVVAHEFGHGIDDTTPGAISGGGTQEFIADVFGAVTEAYSNQSAEYDAPDYTVGEEIDLVGSGPIRNMYDPSKVNGDPNCYSDDIPDTEVHSAAGPGNHWFYLLAEGNKPGGEKPESPTCDSSDVTGIGVEKAAKILYNAMLLKTSDSSYLKYRTWTLTAAKSLFPGSCAEFDTVKAAWDAVSVPAQSDDPTCDGGTDPTPSPTDPTSSPTDPTPSPTDPTETPTDPTPSPTDPTTTPGGEVDFTGVAALSNCSASVIRFADSKETDQAFGLTNGHCYEGGMPEPGEVVVDQPSDRTFTLLDKSGEELGDVQATKLLYSTMTKTDISLYQLGKTYQELSDEFQGFAPLTLAEKAPADGTAIGVVSGYWKKIYSCSVDKTVYQLKEAGWTMDKSIKYKQPGCETIGGTSGSPVVDASTHEVIGANNTGNEDGARCTLNNPCEVDENGNVTVEKGAAYGQQTWWIYTCLTADHTLDLTKDGCELPAPAGLRARR